MDEPQGPLTEAGFEALLEACRALAVPLDLPTLLGTIIERAARVVKAEAGAVLLLDEKTGELYFDAAVGGAGEKVKQIRLKPGEGVAGWVARERQPLIVNDPMADPRWAPQGDRRSDFVTRQVVAVPLISQGRLVGVVEAVNKWEGNRFTLSDRQVLEIFASQAAVAVENARLFGRLRSEKEAMAALVRDMSDGALLCDGEGRITVVNAAGARLLGVDEAAAVGQSIVDVTRAFRAEPTWKQALASPEPLAIDLSRDVGKTLILSGTVQPRREGPGRLFMFRDVTEARREDRLKKNFLSFISHKLKTPLVSITGFAPMLLEDKTLKPAQRQGLTAILEQGQKLAQLVERLLDFVTVEAETVAINRRRLRVGPALEKVVAGLAPELERRGLRVDLDEGLEALPPSRPIPAASEKCTATSLKTPPNSPGNQRR